MPLRPDLSIGMNGLRQSTPPVRLPKMNFPMLGGVPETFAAAGEENATTTTMGGNVMSEMFSGASVQQQVLVPETKPAEPAAAPRESGQIVVYGRAGCQACINAIQDLIDRQASFTYHDVTRDPAALQSVQAITGGSTVVPVIVQIGFQGDS